MKSLGKFVTEGWRSWSSFSFFAPFGFIFKLVSSSSLIVKLINGEDLPSYRGEAPNVSMEIQLQPIMKKDILKTEIHERNANPVFNEVFAFELSHDVVKQQVLRFTLIYMDKYSHAFSVGEVTHPLDHLEQEHSGALREEMIVCREIQKLKKVSTVGNPHYWAAKCPINHGPLFLGSGKLGPQGGSLMRKVFE